MRYLAAEVIDLHTKGMTQKQMAAHLNCGLNTIRRRMKELNLQPKSVGSRNYQINSHVFDNIDTEEKAYWLGFFLADACVAKSAGSRRMFRLSLKKQDEKHVRLAAKFLGFRGKFGADNRDNHPRFMMIFNDVVLCKTLMNYGWWNYKTGKSFEILDCIPDDLFHHFIRGYYDGDGCISYRYRTYKNGNIGSQKKWYCNIVCKFSKSLEIMSDRIEKLGGPISVVRPRKSVYDIRWSNRARVSAIVDWMYKNSTVVLSRKLSRRHEFDGILPFTFNNICDFKFNIRSDDLIARKDQSEIVGAFTAEVLASKWYPPKYDYAKDLQDALNHINCLDGGCLVSKSTAGNRFILKHQPLAWHVRQNHGPVLANFASYPSYVVRAVKNFCLTPNKSLSVHRFIRELRFSGFTMASLLPSHVILSAIKHFGLSGTWFDPCAGWGNRLLASYIAKIDYIATDPGVVYNGLVGINQELNIGAILYKKKWQDVIWPDACFVLTSPPFYNKEDYLDGVDYGKFENWYLSFLKPLVNKSLQHADKVVIHVDDHMKSRLSIDFEFDELPLIHGSKHKVATEWFIHFRK